MMILHSNKSNNNCISVIAYFAVIGGGMKYGVR